MTRYFDDINHGGLKILPPTRDVDDTHGISVTTSPDILHEGDG